MSQSPHVPLRTTCGVLAKVVVSALGSMQEVGAGRIGGVLEGSAGDPLPVFGRARSSLRWLGSATNSGAIGAGVVAESQVLAVLATECCGPTCLVISFVSATCSKSKRRRGSEQ